MLTDKATSADPTPPTEKPGTGPGSGPQAVAETELPSNPGDINGMTWHELRTLAATFVDEQRNREIVTPSGTVAGSPSRRGCLCKARLAAIALPESSLSAEATTPARPFKETRLSSDVHSEGAMN